MTKTKQVTAAPSLEEEEFLLEEARKNKAAGTAMPQMKQLMINADRVDEDGKKIDPDTWVIRGEKVYSDTVTFRPLRFVNKFIRMTQVNKQWKTENESIFVSGFEPAYDMKGSVGCGRVIGKLPDNWTEVQKETNFKKATIYGFLFGLVTFPDAEPQLVNFRASPGKARVVRDAIAANSIGAKTKLYTVDFEMKLAPPAKGEKFPLLTMIPDLAHIATSFSDMIPYIRECDSFIESHNARIMQRREQLGANIKAASTYNEVSTLSEDFNDSIPF